VAFAAFLAEQQLGPGSIGDWELVLTELFTNAVIHGSGRDASRAVSVQWEASDDDVRLTVGDSGPGPDPAAVHSPRLPDDDLSPHGRGLYLIHRLVDEIHHWRGESGYLCQVRRRRPEPRPELAQDALLERAMGELSTCYESLAAFYRLGDALVASETVLDFLRQASADLRQVAPHDVFRIYLGDAIQNALLAELAMADLAFPLPRYSPRIWSAFYGEETSWSHCGEVAGEHGLAPFQSGILCPIHVTGRPCGVLMLANQNQQMPLNAAVRNTVRTFADLIGIAVVNASNAQVRDRETQALRELEIASEMQDRLLPLPQMTSGAGWRAFVRRRTAQEVSGDHVEICESRAGDLYFCMIDVMGKGVPAAFLAAMFRTALHISLTFQYSLVGLLMALNRTLCRELEDMTMFATCAIARTPKNLQKIEIVNAGHCPVLGCSGDQRLFTVEPSGPPLGIFPDAAYAAERFALTGPARVLMVTDGLFEWDYDGDVWGWPRFLEFLEARKAAPADAIWRELRSEIDAHASQTHDDQTFLCWEKT